MSNVDKKAYIQKYINLLDINKKEKICQILMIHGVKLKKNVGGVYVPPDEYVNLKGEILNSIYEYVKNSIHMNH